jgi:purine-binding chemotaxis protein CheW
MEGDAKQSFIRGEGEGQQYLTFLLGYEEYGVDILAVQEIRGWSKTTVIPNAPAYMRGVINLRGIIVPIIDLRKRFNMPEIEFTSTTVVIVVKVSHVHGERTVGLVVDAVSDVHTISHEDINKSPIMAGSISTKYIKGLANIDEKMVIILTVDELINEGVLEEVNSIDTGYPGA